MNARAHAAIILSQVIRGHKDLRPLSLTDAIAQEERKDNFPVDQKALTRELSYGVCRWYNLLDFHLKQLLSKPLKTKDQDIYFLMLVGVYQLYKLNIPDHAAISETVNASRDLKKNWSSKLVNAVLRSFQRQQKKPHEGEIPAWIRQAHPDWLYKLLSSNHPEDLDSILEANNSKPPMCLRVNIRKNEPEAYLKLLQSVAIDASIEASLPHAIYLNEACNVSELPGFDDGLVSVQDEAAQWAAHLLELKPEYRVLDACAAPGGKTAHILETCPDLEELIALDISPQRTEKILASIERLQLSDSSRKLSILTADAMDLNQWWDGNSFQRILLDAPCSATGVIRRHPDIKWLRDPSDIKQLAKQQGALLQSLWQTLDPNGLLLYATCSVLSEENEEVIEQFLHQHKNAEEIPIHLPVGTRSRFGWQLLPNKTRHDGFFYALIRKLPV